MQIHPASLHLHYSAIVKIEENDYQYLRFVVNILKLFKTIVLAFIDFIEYCSVKK